MIDFFKVITVTHRQVDIAAIEDYVVKVGPDESLPMRLQQLKLDLGIQELVYLSTCNRVCYLCYMNQPITPEWLQKLVLMVNPSLVNIGNNVLDEHVSIYEGIEAIQYIYEVSGSIDSLVVGEREIYRQLRFAFDYSVQEGLSGDNMRLLEKSTVPLAKKIYTNTRIGENPLSIAALAMDMIKQNNPLKDEKVIFVGAGETNSLLAKFFKKDGFNNFEVYNRSLENAARLAKYLVGNAYKLELLSCQVIKEARVLIVCTGSQDIIVSKQLIEDSMLDSTNQLVIVDLSVPRNVDHAVSEIGGIKYVYIDELKALASKNLEFRKQEISLAKAIVQKALPEFRKLYAQRQLEISLAQMPEEIKKVRHKALTQVFEKEVAELDENARATLEKVMDYFEKKAISIPMKIAKKSFDVE